MATTKAKAAEPSIEQWIEEAREIAGTAIERGISLEHGDVIPRNPALRYVVIDGDLPKGNITRHKARLESMGYRDVTSDVEAVVGYTAFVVYAIPVQVYREVLRPERVRRLRQIVDRFGMQAPMVHRPAGPQLS